MPISSINAALVNDVLSIDTGLWKDQRGSAAYKNDIEITAEHLGANKGAQHHPNYEILKKQLQSENQSLYLSSTYLRRPPYAPLTAEDIKKQLSDPNSIAYKQMSAMIVEYVMMILQYEQMLVILQDMMFEKGIFERAEARAYSRRYRYINDEFPLPKREIETSLPIQVTIRTPTAINLALLETKLTHQKAQNFLFLSRFAKPEDMRIVRDSVERRHEEQKRIINTLRDYLQDDPNEKQQELIDDQVERLARSVELSSEIMQTKILGDVIQDLMDPVDENGESLFVEGASINDICLRFESAEQAANTWVRKELEKLGKPFIEQPEKEQKQLKSQIKAAESIHYHLTQALDDYENKINEILNKMEQREYVSEDGLRYLALLDHAPAQHAAILTIMQLMTELADKNVSHMENFHQALKEALTALRQPFGDGQLSTNLVDTIEQYCGRELDKLQGDLKRYVDLTSKKPDYLNGQSEGLTSQAFWKKAQNAALEKVSVEKSSPEVELKEESDEDYGVLFSPVENKRAIETCLEKFEYLESDDLAPIKDLLVSLKEKFENTDERDRMISEVKDELTQLAHRISDRDVLNEINDTVLAIPCLAEDPNALSPDALTPGSFIK